MSKAQVVQLQVNQQNLMANLKYAFANKLTVLSELMQNARRAKASRVEFTLEGDVLTVVDDGIGISDMQDLLTVAQSGWDGETKEVEKPYGMGWLSCLFSAKHVTVESRGKLMKFDTENAIAFRGIEVHDAPSKAVAGTRLVLTGFNLSEHRVGDSLKAKAKGFAIPVFFQRVEIANPMALDKLQTSFTSVGHVYVRGVHDNLAIDTNPSIIMFLQGLPIYSSGNYSHYDVMVHLDSKRFFGKMPDRDSLVDKDDVVKEVKSVIKTLVRDKLESDRSAMPEDEWLDKYWEVFQYADCVEVANAVPLIPIRLFSVINDVSPEIDEYSSDDGLVNLDPAKLPDIIGEDMIQGVCFKRAAFEKSLRVVHLPDVDQETHYSVAYQLANELDCLVAPENLPKWHWIESHIIEMDADLYDDEKDPDVFYEVTAINQKAEGRYKASWDRCFGDVIVADSFHILMKDTKGNIVLDAPTNDSFVWHRGKDDAVYCCTIDGDVGNVGFSTMPRMLEDFTGGWDDFMEDEMEDECEQFSIYVNSLVSTSPEKTMERLMGKICWDIRSVEQLRGHAFTLSVDKDGDTSIAQQDMRYFAVTGRIPGDDEDALHVFHVATREDALAAFEAAMWENEPNKEEGMEAMRKEHGQTVFWNSVVASSSPIEAL